MNDQDRDLIAALAQGQLSAPAAADATAHIQADPGLAAEYADQVIALQFLQSATPPVMTQTERSKLHANLTEKLGLLPAAAPAPAVSK
jgi:anti-sigma factor RsiW